MTTVVTFAGHLAWPIVQGISKAVVEVSAGGIVVSEFSGVEGRAVLDSGRGAIVPVTASCERSDHIITDKDEGISAAYYQHHSMRTS